MNKPVISTIIASAAMAIANSARKQSGNRNQGVTIDNMQDLRKYANNPRLAKTVTEVVLLNKEVKEIPREVFNLTNLEYLSLSENQITEIPKEIGNMINLERLDLYENQITEIPKEIGNLTNLNYLDLNYNEITEIPKEIGNLTNLEYLEIYQINYQIQSPTKEELMHRWIPSGFNPKVAKILFPYLPSQQSSIRRF